MSRPQPSPVRSHNGNIPIYLDTGNRREQLEPKEHSEYICPTCETDSREHPIHCISISSPSPPAYDSIVTPTPSSRNLAVPVLNLQTRHHSPPPQRRPQPPRPALQFDPEGRPHVRFRRNAFSPLSPSVQKGDIDWSRKSCQGLGISDAPFRPDSSPITPGTAENGGGGRTEERDGNLQGASNFAQRIEEKLWKYSASRNVVKRWLLEMISWSISAACMAGIIVMLLIYKNDRIPKWPLGLTLNAYISVLSKISSAALLLPVSEALGQLKWSWFQGDNSKKMWDFEIFDNASRGPWGSLLLLVRTKGKSLAALGAAVTLFALALDPFFQQVVEYPEHWRLQDGHGSIPIATTYGLHQSDREYFNADTELLGDDRDMRGVVDHYFYDRGTLPITFGKGVRAEVPLACPNSNCTWPEYETLGVCSKCADAADLLEFKCLNTTLDWVQIPGEDEETGLSAYSNGTSCGWYLKADNPLLMTGYNVDSDTPHSGEVLIERAQPLFDLFSREFLAGYTAKLNEARNPISHAIITHGGSLDDILRNATPKAQECVLSWCAKSILSTYSEGGYEEKIVSTVGNKTMSSSPWTVLPIIEDGKEIGKDYFYFENVLVDGRDGVTYEVDNYTHVLTLQLFDDVFPSSYTLLNSTNETDAMLRYKQYMKGARTRNMTYNPFLHDNITTHMERLGNSMTNLIRTIPKNTEMVDGSAFDKESFVDVRWVWLALPLGLLGLTFIFLISTVIRSSIEQEYVGVWKTSAIATLLYGLPDDMQKKITTSKVNGTPRAKAKELRVKWLPRSGWRFSGGSDLSPDSSKTRHPSPPPNWI